MSINHHLDNTTLFSYVAGSLSQGMALVVASHLSVCDACRERVFEIEAIGGALLDNITSDNATTELNDSALEHALACLEEESPTLPTGVIDQDQVVTNALVSPSEVPEPLCVYIGSSLDDIAWKRFSPGFFFFDVFSEGPGMCRLLKLAPGKSILPHTHRGNELTLLLRGSYTDGEKRFTEGDIADLDDQTEHKPEVDGNEGCICLVATDYPLRFTTLLGKVLQPITPF